MPTSLCPLCIFFSALGLQGRHLGNMTASQHFLEKFIFLIPYSLFQALLLLGKELTVMTLLSIYGRLR